MDILNLPDWETIDMQESEYDYAIHAKYLKEPEACLRCGVIGQLYRHGIKRQCFMDLPIHNKRVGLIIHRQRYHCRACGKTSFQPLPDMDKHFLMTSRLLFYLIQTAGKRNNVTVARQTGVSARTIGRILTSFPHFPPSSCKDRSKNAYTSNAEKPKTCLRVRDESIKEINEAL